MIDTKSFIWFSVMMFNELVTVFHTWNAYLQVLFILSISLFLTNIVIKFFAIISNIVSTIPIMMHGWPKDITTSMEENEEEIEKEIK